MYSAKTKALISYTVQKCAFESAYAKCRFSNGEPYYVVCKRNSNRQLKG